MLTDEEDRLQLAPSPLIPLTIDNTIIDIKTEPEDSCIFPQFALEEEEEEDEEVAYIHLINFQ